MIRLGRFHFFWWGWRAWIEGIPHLVAPPVFTRADVFYVRLGPLDVRIWR